MPFRVVVVVIVCFLHFGWVSCPEPHTTFRCVSFREFEISLPFVFLCRVLSRSEEVCCACVHVCGVCCVLRVCLCSQTGSDHESGVFMCVRVCWASCSCSCGCGCWSVCAFGTLHVSSLCHFLSCFGGDSSSFLFFVIFHFCHFLFSSFLFFVIFCFRDYFAVNQLIPQQSEKTKNENKQKMKETDTNRMILVFRRVCVFFFMILVF